jgi:single-strand DNA-binding protein
MEALITVRGNVGSEIELRRDENNQWVYARFRLACTPRINRNGQWCDGETTWLSINCRHRALSENLKSSVGKGDPVIVQGRLVTWLWTDKATGEVKERLVVDAQTVGHDLNRGTSAFRRGEQRVASEPPEASTVFSDLDPEAAQEPDQDAAQAA